MPIKKEIAERLARGEDKDAILAAFSAKYGEKILSSPTSSGFNWFAWMTPFAAVLAGGIGSRRSSSAAGRARAAAAVARARRGRPPTTSCAGRLARELDDFDRDA